MNIEERDRVLSIISEIENYSLAEEIAKYYPDSHEVSSISVGRYPIKDFIHFFKKAISSLKSELNSENYIFYPIQGSAQPIAGIQIETVLTLILNYLLSNNPPEIATLLDKLITYEYYFGIWLLSSHKLHKPAEVELAKKKSEIDLLSKSLNLTFENIDNKFIEIENSKTQVDEFLSQKQQELVTISSNLAKSASEIQQINQILLQAQGIDANLNTILTIQNEKLEQIKGEFEEEQKAYSGFETNAIKLEKDLGESLKNAEDKFTKFKADLDFIESKRKDIIKLTGLAADGALGYKFDDRQARILKGIGLWKWGVPVVTILAIIWVVVVFTYLSAHFDNYWMNLIVNVFKTFPVFILMGFVFKQYSKERNLQEEYAFKAAVAMSISAYSDMLKDQDSENNKSRQEMLANAIREVYSSPKLHTDVKQRLLTFNNKELKEAISQLSEVLNQTKNLIK